MQARSIHLSSFDNMFNDRLTVDLQMWTGINVANFSFCRLLCYASIFMCIIWFCSRTVSTFLILTMQEQTAELKLHWWFEFIRLKKMGQRWQRWRWQGNIKEATLKHTPLRTNWMNTFHIVSCKWGPCTQEEKWKIMLMHAQCTHGHTQVIRQPL